MIPVRLLLRVGMCNEARSKHRQNEFRIEVFGPAWPDSLEQDHWSVLGKRGKSKNSANARADLG